MNALKSFTVGPVRGQKYHAGMVFLPRPPNVTISGHSFSAIAVSLHSLGRDRGSFFQNKVLKKAVLRRALANLLQTEKRIP